MKINWGTGIVIAIGLFMAFILYFVITMMTNSDYDHDLVIEDYYKQEIGFQDELDARNNAAQLEKNIRIEQSPEGVKIVFPKEYAEQVTEGKVMFYRVNQKKLDFEKPLSFTENTMFIPAGEIVSGRWDLSVYWNMNGEDYTVKEKINF
ncbi:MAG: FixH family protein [Flavobacteriaceae bacterium]